MSFACGHETGGAYLMRRNDVRGHPLVRNSVYCAVPLRFGAIAAGRDANSYVVGVDDISRPCVLCPYAPAANYKECPLKKVLATGWTPTARLSKEAYPVAIQAHQIRIMQNVFNGGPVEKRNGKKVRYSKAVTIVPSSEWKRRAREVKLVWST